MKLFISLLVLSVGLLVAAACGGAAEPTPTAMPTPTATPIKEWNLEGIQVDGSTVTVSVRVFAGIDLWATLDGKRSDEVTPTPPPLSTFSIT